MAINSFAGGICREDLGGRTQEKGEGLDCSEYFSSSAAKIQTQGGFSVRSKIDTNIEIDVVAKGPDETRASSSDR